MASTCAELIQHLQSTFCEQFLTQSGAQFMGIETAACHIYRERCIRQPYERNQIYPLGRRVDGGVGTNRERASATQPLKKTPLLLNCQPRVWIVDVSQASPQITIRRPALHSQCPLPNLRNHL